MPREVEVPKFISDNAERGLRYVAEGKGGEGMTDKTIREARDMVSGKISEDKVRRMGPWFARHKVDMDAPANDPDNEDFPGKGAVAWLVWGGSTSGDQMDAAKWAERTAERLEREEKEAAYLTSPTTKENMDTIESKLLAAEATLAEAIATREEIAAKAVEAKSAFDAALAERDAKVAELTAALEAVTAEKEAIAASLAAATANAVTASEEAAKVAASVGVAPVESAPDVAPKASILEQYLALSGAERNAFYLANSDALKAALRK